MVSIFLSAKQAYLLFYPGTIGSSPEMFERANPSLKKFRLDASGIVLLFWREGRSKRSAPVRFYSFE